MSSQYLKDPLKNKSVLLTGGRAAKEIYGIWNREYPINSLSGINFYFGDERCVPSSSLDSNCGMINSVLFSNGIPIGCNLFPMNLEFESLDIAAKSYADLLPQKADLVILSAGEDGHIASLFPGSKAVLEEYLSVLCVTDPNGKNRLTITPKVIRNASEVVVIAYGASKQHLLKEAQMTDSAFKFPASLVRDAAWIVGDNIDDMAEKLWIMLKNKSHTTIEWMKR
ncbi:hypothetical protein G6656_09015 [Polynucleobacter paneuropaeus]|nr:hypothetical protein [Polynucleobacter paneuropaeus]